jgi:membrane protein YqaA with SNARE-associated domain
MDFSSLLDPSPEAGIAGLFVASVLSATLLPGGSEAVLYALLKLHPHLTVPALLAATVGNTLGGLSTYWMARLIPARELPPRLDWVRRYGSASLSLAWAPLVGDALCAAAGWLRLNWLACALWMAAGKFARYAAIVWLGGA